MWLERNIVLLEYEANKVSVIITKLKYGFSF